MTPQPLAPEIPMVTVFKLALAVAVIALLWLVTQKKDSNQLEK